MSADSRTRPFASLVLLPASFHDGGRSSFPHVRGHPASGALLHACVPLLACRSAPFEKVPASGALLRGCLLLVNYSCRCWGPCIQPTRRTPAALEVVVWFVQLRLLLRRRRVQNPQLRHRWLEAQLDIPSLFLAPLGFGNTLRWKRCRRFPSPAMSCPQIGRRIPHSQRLTPQRLLTRSEALCSPVARCPQRKLGPQPKAVRFPAARCAADRDELQRPPTYEDSVGHGSF